MPKILLFSDIHIHPHKKSQERLQDCLIALEWVFETAKKQNVDFVLFGGDLLHDRQKIDTLTYIRTFNILEKYQNETFQTYLLVGNHDMWFAQDWSVASVMPYKALKNFTVVAETKNIQLKGTNWFFMPYTHDPIEELKKCKTDIASTYLLGHLSIDGAKLNSAGSQADVVIEHDGDMVKVSKNLFDNFKIAFFGHYHSHQVLAKNVMYIGSPLQLSYGEANEDKFILLLDTEDNSIQKIKNTFSPKHYYINEDDLPKYDKSELEGSFVTILTSDSSSNSIKKNMALVVEHGASAVQVKKLAKKSDEHAIVDAKMLFADEDTLLQKYVEQVNDVNLEKNILIDLGHKIMSFKPDA